jgi:hypothetical protein
MDRETEEVERIPWAMLAEDIEGPRRRWILQAAGMVVVAIVAGVIATQVIRRPSGTIVDLTPAALAAADTAPSDPILPGAATAGEPATSDAGASMADADVVAAPLAEAQLYSEADLMAVLPEQPSLSAAARAEWFVVDFFGATGAGAVPGLPSGLPDPEVGDGYSWVEWAKAIEAAPRPGGGFDVTVAFRTLTGSADEGYRKLPVRAVVVPVTIGEEGTAVVVDLPTPVEIPDAEAATAPELEESLPEEVAAAAGEAAMLFGELETVVGGSAAASGWRVVVMVGDGSGIRWPLVVNVDA